MPAVMNRFLAQIGRKGFGCNECGRNLRETDRVTACPDCGAIICERCVTNGRIDEHICEEDEFEFE